MPKIQPQSHTDILNTIVHAQAAGKSLEVSKDGRVKEASLGTRFLRAVHGNEWNKNEYTRTAREVGNKLVEAIERGSNSNKVAATNEKVRALFERSATKAEIPSSGALLQLLGKKAGVSLRNVDATQVGFRREDIGEVLHDQRKDWVATGNFLKIAGEFFKPGQIGDASKVRPHVQDLLTDPSMIKDHEVGQVNRFLWDSGSIAPGSAVDGRALADTLDKGKFYNYAVTLNEQGKPVVVLGFEDEADGSSLRFSKESGQRGQGMGHPTLTQAFGGKAVFGGELMYIEDKGWTINNSSGRYGSGKTEVMEQHGIEPDDLLAFAADLLKDINFPLDAVNRRSF